MTRWRAILFALTLLLGGCTENEGFRAEWIAPDARFVINVDNTHTAVGSLDEVLKALPFKPALPSYLPPGVRLRSAQALLPPPPLPSMAAQNWRQLLILGFGSDDISFGIQQQLPPPGGTKTDDPVEEVQQGKSQGRFVRLPLEASGRPRPLILLWDVCGLESQLLAEGGELTDDEAVRIAASTLEACD